MPLRGGLGIPVLASCSHQGPKQRLPLTSEISILTLSVLMQVSAHSEPSQYTQDVLRPHSDALPCYCGSLHTIPQQNLTFK